MRKLLLILFIFFYGINILYANEIKNIPIIKRLDNKYLDLIDKNGKITNLKEFNKNGVVLVFKGKGFDSKKPIYLIINTIIDPISGLDILHVIYTKAIEPYFLNKPAKINFDYENGEYKAPIMNFKLDMNNFTFIEFIAYRNDQKLRKRISKLYRENQLEEISKIISGYVMCIIRTDNAINRKLQSIFEEGCEIEFYDKKKKNKSKIC